MASKSLREQMAANRLAERQLAMMTEGIFKPQRIAVTVQTTAGTPITMKPKKTAVQLPKRSEHDVSADIKSMALHHPKVSSIRRSNSGQMTGVHGGKKRFVTFNKFTQANRAFTDSRDIRISDMEISLKGNTRKIYVEAKASDFREPDWLKLEAKEGLLSEEDARLLAQRRFLGLMIADGHVGLFASDVSQVLEVLERIA